MTCHSLDTEILAPCQSFTHHQVQMLIFTEMNLVCTTVNVKYGLLEEKMSVSKSTKQMWQIRENTMPFVH